MLDPGPLCYWQLIIDLGTDRVPLSGPSSPRAQDHESVPHHSHEYLVGIGAGTGDGDSHTTSRRETSFVAPTSGNHTTDRLEPAAPEANSSASIETGRETGVAEQDDQANDTTADQIGGDASANSDTHCCNGAEEQVGSDEQARMEDV